MSKPKIYAFSNTMNGGEGEAIAMAEDGAVVGSHWCSNEGWVPHDLGVTSDWHHEGYKEHYPNGFEVVFVKAADVDGHEGLQSAVKLHRDSSAPKASREWA